MVATAAAADIEGVKVRPRIAVFSGPTATIGNSPPLVTSNQSRARHGLPLLTAPDGRPLRADVLRLQRLAAPVTVYVEAFSAHPLETDARHLYAGPDGWVDTDGTFHTEAPAGGGTPVYVVELKPEDGLLPLPYMARQADGSAWDDVTAYAGAPFEQSRQSFYPDARRIYEEIDRLGVHGSGRPVGLMPWPISTSSGPRRPGAGRPDGPTAPTPTAATAPSPPNGGATTSSATTRPTCAASRPSPRSPS